MTIKVGIVDDSVVVRSVLEKIIDNEPEFKVVGKSEDVFSARTMIMNVNPDVITLDVEMPKMDGLTFLERLMEHQPMPVVMVSSLTKSTSRKGMEALDKGAVEIVAKPSGDKSDSIHALEDELLTKLKAAYRARNQLLIDRRSQSRQKKNGPDVELSRNHFQAVLIGSSTGGVQALQTIFEELTADLPPLLVVQHMPPVFTEQFSRRLNELSKIRVAEATEGDRVESGQALLAPGDHHMLVRRRNQSGAVKVTLNQDERVHSQRPSVDVLFTNASEKLDPEKILAMVLTGMGKDGRDGCVVLEQKSSTILVQDEASSTVYGMPKQVSQHVKSAREMSLRQIAPFLNEKIFPAAP